MDRDQRTILLTGASGFVGRNLLEPLRAAGWRVRAASRRPRADAGADGVEWVVLDLDRPETIAPALEGCSAAVYLVHGMGEGGDFEARERASAEAFARAAEAAGLERIVYLGGVRPSGSESKHLRSRLQTGTILREAGSVPCVELRAGMIVGPGSASFTIVRDLAMRLPAMVLPSWLRRRSQPIAIRDVVAAIVAALELDPVGSVSFDLPGPETLTSKEVLLRVAALRGARPLTIDVPVLSPRLSSHWIRLVSRADFRLAASLVEGLTSDLVSERDDLERLLPGHERQSFDDAAREAIRVDAASLGPAARVVEEVARWITPRLPPQPSSNRAVAARATLGLIGIVAFAIGHLLTASSGPWIPLVIAAAVIVAGTFAVDREQLRPPPVGRLLPRGIAGVGLGLVMAAATFAVYAIVASRPSAIRGEVADLYAWIQTPPGPVRMIPALVLVILAEELVFRGTLYRLCRDRWGDAAAVLIPTTLYALVHLEARSPLLILLAASCGLVWALQRLATGSLLGTFLTHLSWDLVVLVFWPLEGPG